MEKSLPASVPYNLTGRGLLELHDPFPLAVLHLQLPINTLEVLKTGHFKLDMNLSWANSFALDQNFVVDAETWRFDLGGWYALRDDFYVGTSIPVLAREGGVLDGLVDGFHEVFGYTDSRSQRPRNAYELSVTEGGVTSALDSGVGLGDLVLKAHWNLNPGDNRLPAVSIQGLVGLPTSMNGFGSNGVDAGLAVSFYKTFFYDFHLYGVLGGTFLTQPEIKGFRYEKINYQGTGGIEYAVLNKLSLIFQVMSYSPLFEGPVPLDRKRTYLAWGLKWQFVRSFELQLSFIENIAPFENSADVTFATGFSIRF